MQVNEININSQRNYNRWHDFLVKHDISGFAKQELTSIDKTFIWSNEKREIIATGSIAGNVLKYVAIDAKYQQDGAMFNQVISYLVNQAATMNRFHLFVFTKPKYVQSFEYVGFNKLAEVEDGAVLENGTPNISDYIQTLPHVKDAQNKRIAAIVANANPFTKGHRYLVETASKENDVVYVFVVSQNVSLFTYNERFKLVQAGTKDLDNVFVVPGKEYMVSYATFPAYFLKDDQNVGRYQAKLDATLFKEKIAKPLNIKYRYLGSEPYSKTTDVYNEELMKVLPPEVKVKIIERARNDQNDIITATKVREAIKQNDLSTIKHLVVPTTFEFIKEHLSDLQKRIKERM